MTELLRSLAVFCGSSPGHDPVYRRGVAEFGAELARRGIRLIYGGGSVGLMGVLADAAAAGGGEAVGVIPRFLAEREVEHRGLTELVVVDSMHERKARMAELADGFVALPGGLGTLEELFEVWTWVQLGIYAKPCGALDVAGYFAKLVEFLDDSVRAGFVGSAHRDLLIVERRPAALLDRLAMRPSPPPAKWTDLERT